jgi:hypothetical protein
MEEDAIDLRKMAGNFPNGIIPLQDINEAIAIMVSRHIDVPETYDIDPSEGAVISYPNETTSPRMGYIGWDEAYLWTLFQRDVAPRHITKIYQDFEPTCIIMPCAIKVTVDGKIYYCIWDGHHTMQVCRLQGYNKFPVWYIDIDHVPLETIENAGFGDTPEERIKYGVWLAGTNMIRINSKNKRQLSPYDEFMIKLETRDAEAVSIDNIFTAVGCQPVRRGVKGGDFSQFRTAEKCYNLADHMGNKGGAFRRALQVHRDTWKRSPMELEVWRPLCYLHHNAQTQGITLGADFDNEMVSILINKYGDPESIQQGIKDSYEKAAATGAGKGELPKDDPNKVMCGFINLYNQHRKVTNYTLPQAEYRWTV